MKNCFDSAKGFTAIFATLLLCASASQTTAATSGSGPHDGTVTVAVVKGNARYSTGNNVWQPLKAGMTLKPGTVVQTAPSSHVDLVFDQPVGVAREPEIGQFLRYSRGGGGGGGGGSRASNVVRVTPDSILAIDKHTILNTGADQVTETQLDLRAGKVLGNVKKLSAASKYEIKFPNGVAGIRGTFFVIDASGFVNVLLGGPSRVAYVDASGNTVVSDPVNAGERFNPTTGTVEPIPGYDPSDPLAGIPPFGAPGSTLMFVTDHTIIFISPTIGDDTQQQTGSGGG